jgi:hypothetical protein
VGKIIQFPERDDGQADLVAAYERGIMAALNLMETMQADEKDPQAALAGVVYGMVRNCYEICETTEGARTLLKAAMERVELGVGPE